MNRTPWSLHANSLATVVAADGKVVGHFNDPQDADAVVAWSRMGDLAEREELKEENARLEEECDQADAKIAALEAQLK